jgi:uncharacterized protein YpmS
VQSYKWKKTFFHQVAINTTILVAFIQATHLPTRKRESLRAAHHGVAVHNKYSSRSTMLRPLETNTTVTTQKVTSLLGWTDPDGVPS